MRNRGLYIVLGALLLLASACVRCHFGDAFRLVGDDEKYYQASQHLRQTGDLFEGARRVGDIYAYRWLATWGTAFTSKVFGDGVGALTLVQQVAATLLVLLTLVVAWQRLGPAGGLLAAALACFTPIGIQFAATLSPDGLLALCTVAALFCLLGATSELSRTRACTAGLFMALGFLMKEEALKHLPALLVAVVLMARAPRRQTIMLFLLPVVAAVAIDTVCCWRYLGNPWAHVEAARDNLAMWRRMGTVDPSGTAWSFGFYPRRLLWPFGPFAFLFPLACIGAWLHRRERALWIWFVVQLGVFIVSARFGQIQERMLQPLLPVIALFAAVALVTLSRRFGKAIGGFAALLVLLGAIYVVLAKFDLRRDAAPRAAATCAALTTVVSGEPIYAELDFRFHCRDHVEVLDWHQMSNETSRVMGVVDPNAVPEGWSVIRTLYTSERPTYFWSELTEPVRRNRKENPAYAIAELQR